MSYNSSAVVELLKENMPIAVCNGTRIGPHFIGFENWLISWLESNLIPCTKEDNLYNRESFDLSKYKTIAFNTQGEERLAAAFEKIVNSFSKENLRVIIVANSISYLKVRDLAGKLGIKVIYFDYSIPKETYSDMKALCEGVPVNEKEVWEDAIMPDLFFDPQEVIF